MEAVVVRPSLVLGAFLYTAAPGGAQTPLGALAIDERQGDQYGWAVNYETAEAARRRALSECGSACSVVLMFERCAAYAADQHAGSTAFGWAESYDSAAGARQRALAECGSRGGSACTVQVWGCNGHVVEESLGLGRAARREFQEGLQAARFDPGGADGIFGPRTRAAIRSWQTSLGARATGFLDNASAAVLQPSAVAVRMFRERSGADAAAAPTAVPEEQEPASAGQPASPAGSAELEALFWQSIVNSENPTDFEAYLAQFPNGVFRRLAENRLSALQPAPQVSANAAPEALFWQSIVNSENPTDFEAYLAQFPNGVFRRLAENRLSALQPVASPPPVGTAPEDLFWESTANSENPAEFEAYLAQFPNGVFRRLAENRLSALQSPSGAPAGVSASPANVADSPAGGEVCGVPAAEAVLVTWQNTADNWSMVTPAGNSIASFSSERAALGSWADVAAFECEVAILVDFREFTGRFYRLDRKIEAGETDARSLIIDDPAVAANGPANVADSPAGGEVCEVPADEAVLVTWQNTAGNWNIVTPAGNSIASFSSERAALGSWADVARFECEVAILVNFREFTGRFYRLNREMHARETDARSLIIGDPVVAADPGLSPGDVFRDCEECPEMVVLPSGDLAMGRYEVTVGEYRAFVSATGGTGNDGWWDHDSFRYTDRHPVVNVNWGEAQAYVSWLTRTAGARYRLPTESEWERAAAGSPTGCGNRFSAFRDGSGEGTCEVGTNGTNAAGLSDMVGNVWEWTSDCWEGDCGRRVFRGGSWSGDAEVLRPGARMWLIGAGGRGSAVGFRVSRTLD